MKLYKFNFFYDYQTQSGEMYAHSRYDVEQKIITGYPNSTAIHIWSV
jgi:hypothetical protein